MKEGRCLHRVLRATVCVSKEFFDKSLKTRLLECITAGLAKMLLVLYMYNSGSVH